MKRTTLHIRAVITGTDRIHGRMRLDATPTLTQHATLWQASRLHSRAAARKRLQSERRAGFLAGIASAGRRFLMALGIL